MMSSLSAWVRARRLSSRAVVQAAPPPGSALRRAAYESVETLERRLLLTVALPTSVHCSADAAYTLSGNAGAYTLALTAGTWSLDADISSAGSDWQNLSLQLGAGVKAAFNSPETLGGLQLAASAKAIVSPGSGGVNGNVLTIGATGLSVDPAATLDLADNDMILQNAGSAGVSQIQALLHSGYDNGDWKGLGLTSSSSGANVGTSTSTAIGFALESSLPLGVAATSFDGLNVGSNDVLVKYTIVGDALLLGYTNAIASFQLRRNLNHTGTTWVQGDFNYDGVTNSSDNALLIQGLHTSSALALSNRTLQPTGLTLMPIEGQDFTGTVSTFTDANTPTTASDYVASIEWGNGVFLPATVTADPNGGFDITGTSPTSLTDPDALVVAMVQYSSSSVYAGRPAVLSEPIQIVPAVSTLNATAISSGEIDLSWTVNASNASAIEVDRSVDGVVFSPITTTLSGTTTTYADTDPTLTENTPYYYEVRAIQPRGASIFSNVASTFTLPATPTGLTATDGSDGVHLSWTNNSGFLPPFCIERSTDGVNFNVIDEIYPGSSTYTDVNPEDGTTYYRVGAVNGDGTALSLSRSASVINPLLAPSDLLAQAVSSSEIDLTWTNNSSVADGTTILRSTDGIVYTPLTHLTDPVIHTYFDAGLVSGAHYYYEVEATQASTTSSACGESDDTTVPSSPTGLSVAVGPTGDGAFCSDLDLSWNASPGATGYDIQREPAGGTWEDIAQIPDGAIHAYSDGTLWDGRAYTYQIDAFNNAGASSMSAAVTATTAMTMPDDPTVHATALSSTSAQVVWVNNAYNESSFVVQRSDTGNAPWTTLETVAPGVDTYIDTGLTPLTRYWYQVMPVDSAGNGLGGTDVTTDSTDSELDTPPTISVGDMQDATELGPDGRPIQGFFQFSRTGDVSASLTVDYTVGSDSDKVATPGREYEALPGQVTFAAGQSTVLEPLTPNEINHVEGVTTVTVSPIAPSGYTLDAYGNKVTINITNTDTELAFNTDDNGPNLVEMNVNAGGMVSTQATQDNFDDLGAPAGVKIYWGDGSSDDGSIPHFFDAGSYNINIMAADGHLIGSFVADIAHTSNPFDPSPPQVQALNLADGGNLNLPPAPAPVFAQFAAAIVPLRAPALINETNPLDPLTPEDKNAIVQQVVADGRAKLQGDQVLVGVYNINARIQHVFVQKNGNIEDQRSGIYETSKIVILTDLTKLPDGWYVGPGGYDAGAKLVKGFAADQQVVLHDDGHGNLDTTLLDGTKLSYKKDGDFGTLVIQRPGEPQVNVAFKSAYKNFYIDDAAGRAVTEIDRLDSPTFDTIVEEKDASGLLKVAANELTKALNSWVLKQISGKMDKLNRISMDGKSLRKGRNYVGGAALPPLDDMKKIRHLRFEIKAASLTVPGLKAAVDAAVSALQTNNPDWTINVVYVP